MIALVATVLAWISAISLAVVTFLGTAVSVGWIVAGAFLFTLAVGGVVISREVRQATEMPDYLAGIETPADAGRRLAFSRCDFRSLETFANRTVIGSRDLTAGSSVRIRPRRVQARQNRPRTSG